MNIKNLLVIFAVLTISACATQTVDNVNDDIVGSDSSGIVSNISTSRERAEIISPITQEHVVKLETKSPLAEQVNFAFDSDVISEEGREKLDAIVELLKKQKKVSIVVEGHCDERGTKAYNLALGARRAQSVKNYLTDQGIAKKKVETVSYGEEKPAIVGTTREAYAQNRRVEFKVR